MPPVADRPATVEIIEVGVAQAGQRIDNFLIKYMKGVPKTRLYRALRGGEVRVNGARKKASYPLCVGDRLRIPPIRRSVRTTSLSADSLLEKIPVLFEDAHLLVVDKPSGLAVHGGTGLKYGLIEVLRQLRPTESYLELVHRLDRETSGCLMLAKSRAALLGLHAQLRQHRSIQKNYVALLKGAWHGGSQEIRMPLTKRPHQPAKRVVDPVQRDAHSIFSPKQLFADCTLVAIELLTGRMHQARMHAAGIGNPIAGDWLYGDTDFNRMTKTAGLTRLFLHAESLRFCHPISGAHCEIHAELPSSLTQVLDHLESSESDG